MDAILYDKIEAESNRIIEAIHGGGGDDLSPYLRSISGLFSTATNLPHEITLSPIELVSNSNNSNTLYRAYEDGQNSATINYTLNLQQSTPFSLSRHLYQAYGVAKCTILGNLQYCTDYLYIFENPTSFRVINIQFDFSSCTSADSVKFTGSGTNSIVTDLRFKPNTLAYSLASLSHFTAANAATLISLANCLRSDVTGQTITLTSGQKDICNNTVGVISDGLFVADASGSVTLTDFITNTKGWTIA